MLSFGPYYQNYQLNNLRGGGNQNVFDNSQYARISSTMQLENAQTTIGTSTMPLTPPGSPDEVNGTKTPIDPRYISHGGGGTSSQSNESNGIDPYSYPNPNPFNQPAAALNSAEMDASTQLISLFYGGNNGASSAITNQSSTPSSPFFDCKPIAVGKRQEKKNVSGQLKDEKYFERRRKNNDAAKRSREARKNREDEIAARAAFLEQDNAILRTQVTALREEAQNLRYLLMQKQGRQTMQVNSASLPFSSS